MDDIRYYVDCSINKEKQRLKDGRESALADQKRIADAERKAREAAVNQAQQSEAARTAAEVARRKLRRLVVIAAAAAVIALLLLALSAIQAYLREQSALESRHQLDRANRALAAWILADLDLKKFTLTVRQRNALWKVAEADEAVHANFVSILSASPEDMTSIRSGIW